MGLLLESAACFRSNSRRHWGWLWVTESKNKTTLWAISWQCLKEGKSLFYSGCCVTNSVRRGVPQAQFIVEGSFQACMTSQKAATAPRRSGTHRFQWLAASAHVTHEASNTQWHKPCHSHTTAHHARCTHSGSCSPPASVRWRVRETERGRCDCRWVWS